MIVDAVVFDMDGTLLSSSATVPAAYAAAIDLLELLQHDGALG